MRVNHDSIMDTDSLEALRCPICIIYIDRKLYLPTLTLSTEADFHRGRVKWKYKYIVYLAIYMQYSIEVV